MPQTPWIFCAQEPIRQAYRNATSVAAVSVGGRVAALLIIVLVAAIIARSITRPLRDLAEALTALARGRTARVASATDEEFARIGQALNTLTEELERSRAALTELNRTLEERIQDRTAELAHAQAQLERYAADIHAAYRAERARSREIEEFVYAVSHDLKTPLVSIQSYAAALRRGGLDAATQEHYLERLARNAEHMEHLMQSLLELARAGTVSEPQVPVATEAMVRELCEARAQPDGRAITFVIGPSLPTVRAERGKLERVFANLIDNAVKYLGQQPAPRIEIGAEAQGTTWRFWVRDNGLGIPAEVQHRLFRPFFRVPDRQTIPGTGMGLALVQKIIRAHGGEVWIESSEGLGTTVFFTLPRYDADQTDESHETLPGGQLAHADPREQGL